MGASLGGGGRRGSRRGFRPMADINVTPMVDVMLVLLVIFMITAPLMTAGVQVDLPKSKAGAIKGDDKPVSVSIKADGTVWLQETAIGVEELAPKLRAIMAEKPEQRIFVRADAGIAYGKVMEVMGAINAAGFPHVALLTQPAPEGGSPPRKGSR